MAVVSMRQLLEAGVHFGHQTRRWNPKMKRFILGERNGIYLIDLRKTLTGVESAYSYVRDLVADGGTVLFVGTKKQTQGPVAEYAEACGMPYVNQRWLGGMLTNFATVSGRVKRMQELRAMQAAGDFDGMPKREALQHTRELEKLSRNLGGIADLERLPNAVFVIDTKKEHIAVTEARKLGLPVVAVVDTNCDPDIIDYVIPGNDDAIRSGSLMCRVIADAVVEGRFIAEHRRQMAPSAQAEDGAAPPPRPAVRPRRPRAGRGGLMANYTAKDVAALRQMTGAGMLDCKNALEEAGGDLDKAVQILREKGLAGAAKRSDREAAEGAVSVARSGDAAAVVELRCETDFVAKADEFVALADELASLVAAKGEDATGEVDDEIDRLRATLKENISVGQVRRLVAEPGQVLDTYLHRQAGRGVNAVAVVVEGGSEELAHEIAVHIAFTKPAYLSRDEVPAADVDAERTTLETISRNEGKPEAALGKIVEGRMNGWFKERVLLDQSYVRDEKQTISGLLGSARIVAVRAGRHRRLTRAIVGDPRRIVLKMSGEALASAASDETIDAATVERMAKEMARAMDAGGLELAVVVGGGNIWRGTTGESGGMDRATSDTMGMLER